MSSQNTADGAGLGAVPQPVAGTWRATDPATAFLTFEPTEPDQGTLHGGDGCNGVGGTYTVDGATAHIKRGFGTLKACIGVDDWLRKVISVTADGDLMHVYDSAGTEIGQLHREQ